MAKLKVSHNELPWLQVVNEIGCSKTNVKEVGCSGWSQVKNIHLKIDSNSKRKISINIKERFIVIVIFKVIFKESLILSMSHHKPS